LKTKAVFCWPLISAQGLLFFGGFMRSPAVRCRRVYREGHCVACRQTDV
jgi:hypothetical protein